MEGSLLQEAVHELNSTVVVEERQLNVVQAPATAHRKIAYQTRTHKSSSYVGDILYAQPRLYA